MLFAVMCLLLRRLVRLLANSSKYLKGDGEVVVLRLQLMVLSATWPSASSPSRPLVNARDEQDASSGSMGPRSRSAHRRSFAGTGSREREVDVQMDLRRRQAPFQRGGPGPHPSDGREPQVGVYRIRG